MNESEYTTVGSSSPTTSTSSLESKSLKWHLKSTQRQRFRQEAIHSEPSGRSLSHNSPKRSQSAPGSVERPPELGPSAPVLPPRESLVTVKFALPTGGVLTRAFPGLTSIAEVRSDLAPILGVASPDLELASTATDTEAHDADVLADLGVGTFGVLSLRITNPPDARLRRDAGDILTAPPPDVLTVLVRDPKEKRPRQIVVEVEKAGGASAKPYLGGLRDSRTGITYHHAAIQTDRVQPTRTIPRFSRDTQAGLRRHQTTATLSESSVQTQLPPSSTDGYIVLQGDANRFENDRQKRFKSACILQRSLRAWFNKRKAQPVTEPQDPTPTPVFSEDLSGSEGGEPDIQALLNAVYKWRDSEEIRLGKISAVLTQRAERLDVLAEHARRLAQVDAVRVRRREARTRRRQEAALRRAARPKSWRGSQGRRLQVDTPVTLLYRRLLNLYETTVHAWHSEPAILRQAADAIEDFDEIISQQGIIRLETLIRRRAAYLERDADSEGSALLERVRDLFLEIPQAEQLPNSSIVVCRSCKRPRPVREFVQSVRIRNTERCATCTRLSTAPRELMTDIKLKRLTGMMRKNEIRMSEGLQAPVGSQPAFMLQPEDIRMLATRIWPGRSVLGGASDLGALRLGRWDSWKPFSPWNCVLLTASELSAHIGSTASCGPEMVYAQPLIARIRRRHLQGSLRFRSAGFTGGSQLDKIQENDAG